MTRTVQAIQQSYWEATTGTNIDLLPLFTFMSARTMLQPQMSTNTVVHQLNQVRISLFKMTTLLNLLIRLSRTAIILTCRMSTNPKLYFICSKRCRHQKKLPKQIIIEFV